MKSKVVVGVIFSFFFVTSCFGEPNTEIRYSVTDLGSDQWEYIYTVENIGLSAGIEEFTIWFDYDLYSDLNIETTTLEASNPPAGNWHEVVWQREEVLRDDGGYDALALDTSININEAIRGFSVSFDWLGIGEPGSQYYEIIDPLDFHTIEDGYTVPEPATVFLLGIGGIALLKKRLIKNKFLSLKIL